ncbi:Selenocysteine-specific elongation factor [Orchesella cincta]|uniref:Selenocysteine-specific elongation factor n=1 Tax=Orchesella cincta TaxID=48709 RepID=A0A1D2MZS6_ORCCI|nr:Selenocysteine-specific elongation factor [Orchesella cincta]
MSSENAGAPSQEGVPLKKTNVSVGVLGHVDSGKTSLCKELSITASTAAFDQNPQSQERGITLDLGFSAFTLEDKWNVTLVDCPGHASLIRTVLGGIQIMDIMLLILDVTKGMQTQSSECLILADVLASHLIVALNKVDMLPVESRQTKIDKAKKMLKATLARTKFGENAPIVLCSALDKSIGVDTVKEAILDKIKAMTLVRYEDRPFVIAVDHCFQKKGQGTICTGTVIQGTVKIGDMVELPEQQIQRKVKTIQSFKVPLTSAVAGDRVGMCIGAFDSSLMERGIISAPGHISVGTRYVLMKLHRIKYYKHSITSKSRFHISIGYETTTAVITLFEHPKENFDFQPTIDYNYVDELSPEEKGEKTFFAVLEFDHPVTTLQHVKIIGSNLQIPPNSNECRLAFYGEVERSCQIKDKSNFLAQIKIYKIKKRQGILDRVTNSRTVIVRGLHQKSSNIDHLLGCKIDLSFGPESESTVVQGTIESRFGQTDKLRVNLNEDLSDIQMDKCKQKQVEVSLVHKKYVFKEEGVNSAKKLIQK